MANYSFNIALGRESEFHWRVDNNDPTNSALVLVVLSATNLEADATLRDYDTLSALLAGTSDEVTNAGYARIVITDAGLSAFTVDDTNNQLVLPLANQTTAAISTGNSWSKLLICYDNDTTGGTDANIIPVKAFDIRDPVTGAALAPSGGTITHSFPNGYNVAS
jgi:hypothetical protein